MTEKLAKQGFARSATETRLGSGRDAGMSAAVVPEGGSAHLMEDGVSVRSSGQVADEKAAVSSGRPRRFPPPPETVHAPSDSGRHLGDRRGYMLRRLLAYA